VVLTALMYLDSLYWLFLRTNMYQFKMFMLSTCGTNNVKSVINLLHLLNTSGATVASLWRHWRYTDVVQPVLHV